MLSVSVSSMMCALAVISVTPVNYNGDAFIKHIKPLLSHGSEKFLEQI